MILDGADLNAVASAAQTLHSGGLLGLPTETVYGLAADAGNDQAVTKIFAAKGRPSEHPLIVHVASAEEVAHFACDVPDFAVSLMQAFWPGPLTLILPRRVGVATVATGGQDSVGVRCPSHPVAQAVLREAHALGVLGVAAPSANVFGRVSPTTAAHVASEFGPDLLVLDGGPCEVGIESTIVDCTRGAPVLLRPGILTPQQLSLACGQTVELSTALRGQADPQAPRASGTLASHYAPSAQVRLIEAHNLATELHAWETHSSPTASLGLWTCPTLAIWASLAPRVHQQVMPQDVAACAHDLFAQLRAFDAQGVSEIWIQTPPADMAWDGVRDRLTRAATPVR
jgi:L-threonylcarbamoyladenylate synthase